MSRSDRDSTRRNRALPPSSDGLSSTDVLPTAAESSPQADARHTSDLHTHFGNTEVMGALDGEWSGGMGPLMADGLDFASTGMGATESVGVSPSNSVMLRAMRDAFQATNYDAGDPILQSLRPSGGEKLPEDVRARFESAMGHKLDHVRIHRDATAASQSDALNAFAFTIGSHIWFGGGRFDPNSVRGQQLLAHELTHVKQHDEGRINPHTSADGLAVSSPSDPLEVEAYAAESAIAGSLPSLESLGSNDGVDAGASVESVHAPVAETSAASASEASQAVLREENPHHFEDVHAGGHHELSDAVMEDFRKAAAEVKKATGHDISKGLGDTTRPLASTTTKSGASNWSWHKTGRAFDINQNLPWVITKEPAGDKMFFRLYLMTKGGGGPTVQFQRNGEPALYHNGAGNNAYKKPFTDVTAILEKHGWSRIPAQKGYSKSGRGYNKQEWWHYEQRDGNSWYGALDEVYDQEEIRDGLRPLRGLGGAENRMRREGVPEEELQKIIANRNASGPAPRNLNVAPPGNSTGTALPPEVAEQLRAVLGDGVDQVRVHTGREAASFAENLNANAVTVGTDVFFNAGRFDLTSEKGLAVLAEEVHHAVMGGGGPGVSQPNDPHEREAKGFASEFAEGLQAAGGLGAAASGAAESAQGAMSGAASGVSSAVSSLTDSLPGGLGALSEMAQAPVQTAESSGLQAMAAEAHQEIPAGMESLIGALGGAGPMNRDMAAEGEAAALPEVNADVMSHGAAPGGELGLSSLQDAVLPGQGLPPDLMDTVHQVASGELDPMSAIEEASGGMAGSMPDMSSLPDMSNVAGDGLSALTQDLPGPLSGLAGRMGRRRRGNAAGSPGFSLNAAGPAPASDANARNANREAPQAGATPQAPASPGVEQRTPAQSNAMNLTAGGGGGAAASAGGGGGGGGAAPQATTPKEPVTSTGTKEHAQAVADAMPSLKAASYATTGSELDGHAQTEGGELHESIPEFHAVLTEDGIVESMSGEGAAVDIATPQTQEAETSETGVVETPEVEPTQDPGEFQATANTASVSNMSAEAPEGDREQAVSQAIRSIPTSDGDINVSPGPAPRVSETGDTDPARADRDRDTFVTQATDAGTQARQAILDSPGSELVVPLVMDEAFQVDALELGSISATEAINPEVQKFLDSTVSGDVIASFDEFESPRMEASHQAFEDAVADAVQTRDTDAETQIEESTAEADRMVAEANAEQQSTVTEQRALIEAERQRTIDAGQTAMDQFNAEARAEHARVSAEVRGEIDRANNQVAAEFARAESEAATQVNQGEAEAQRMQAEAEREQEDQSWWDKATDWIADQLQALADAICDVFNAIRDAVTAILDAVKELATQIIDAAVSFICDALAAFGEFLKAGIQLLVGSVFPDLADALCGYVDEGVAYAQETVTNLGEQLKEGIDSLISAVTDALNAIIDAFNQAVQTAMSLMQAAISGDWVQVLLTLLEAALRLCGINPDEFYGLVGTAEATIDIIVNNPGQFIGNLIEALGQGFGQFADNFLTHLQNGFMEWLTGAAGEAGIDIPETFDLKGLLGLGLQILGITYDSIREKAVEHFGEETVANAEVMVQFMQTMMEVGVVEGLWTYIEGSLEGVWDTVVGGIQEWIAETIVRKAVVKIATMFNPIGAIVQALLTAWDLYNWVKDNVQQIYAVVTSIVTSISDIATGAIGGAANMIEGALGSLVPVAIDLLAKVLGLGNAGEKISEFLQEVREPVDNGIDTAFAWLAERVDNVADFLFGSEEEGAETETTTEEGGEEEAEDTTQPRLTGSWSMSPPMMYAYRSPEGDQMTSLTARGSYALEITDQGAFETQWKRGENWDNAGIESMLRSSIVSNMTPIIANANAAVPEVAQPGVFGGYSAATASNVNNNLTGHGFRVSSITISSIGLGADAESDLEQGEGVDAGDKAFLEARQGFQADGHAHSTWVDTSGGTFTVMVASTPVSGVVLIDRWQSELNTNRFDNDSRSRAAEALREARSAIVGAERLEENLKGCKDDASKARVQGLIRDKQALIKTHMTVGFEVFGDEAERSLEWALEQPGSELAKFKWEQVNADAGRVAGLRGTLPTFRTGVEAHLLSTGAFEHADGLPKDTLISAMQSVVALGSSMYLLKGDPIPVDNIFGAGGVGRCIAMPTVFRFHIDGDDRDAFREEVAASDNEYAKKDPGLAWTYEIMNGREFDENVHLMGETQGRVPTGWWFALQGAESVELDTLREALTLTDTAFDAGFVKLTFSGGSFVDAGFQLFKPTAFDGMHQGWDDDPMWATTGPASGWGLTKSAQPVREGVARPVDVSLAESRQWIRGSVSDQYDIGSAQTIVDEEAAPPETQDYLAWFTYKKNGAAVYQGTNDQYSSNRTDQGFAAARNYFRSSLLATGWDFGNTAFAAEWNRYVSHNEHVGWGQHRLPTVDNPEIKEKHQGTSEYEDLEGAAFVQQPDHETAITDEDVNQGSLGDCYWMAGMAAVARDNQNLIERAISDNGDGTFDVTLHDENNRPVTVTVDGMVPTSGGSATYARPTAGGAEDRTEMWPLLLEKAYARMGGGYEPIEGGFPGEAVRAITGESRDTTYSSGMSDEGMTNELSTALSAGQVVTAWTASDKRTSDEVKKLMEEYQVYANHAYSFRDVNANNGMVSMRNPWGTKHPKPMPMDVFRQIYPYVDINQVRQDTE